MDEFAKDSFVKIVGTNGNYHYGYISEVKEKGFHLLISLYEEGESAVEYEAAAGGLASDWKDLLSDTEKMLIPYLAQDLTNKVIASELSISPVTVRAHVRTLRFKLQLLNRQQLVAFAQGLDNKLRKNNE